MKKILSILILSSVTVSLWFTVFHSSFIVSRDESYRVPASITQQSCVEVVSELVGFDKTDEILEQLKSVKIVEFEQIGGQHATDAYLVTFENGLKGVFKPELVDNELSNSFAEELAYLIDRRFGIGVVPPTVIRKNVLIEDEELWGSLQMYVGDLKSILDVVKERFPSSEKFSKEMYQLHTGELDLRGKEVIGYDPEYINRIKFLDFLISNGDPGYYNILVGKEGRLYSIDNSFSFTTKGTTTYQKFEIYQDRFDSFLETADGKRVIQELKNLDKEQFYNSLLTHISEDSAERMLYRIDDILFRERYKREFGVGLDYDEEQFSELVKKASKELDYETLDAIAGAVKLNQRICAEYYRSILATMKLEDVRKYIARLKRQDRFKYGYLISHFEIELKWFIERS